MKLLTISVFFGLLWTGNAFGGTYFEGWGKTPEAAMDAAKRNAVRDSRAGCLCKDQVDQADYERDCREALGGFICKACGSNHRGSCK